MVRLLSLSDAFQMLSFTADKESEQVWLELDEEPAPSLKPETKTSHE